MWFPYHGSASINTSFTIDSLVESEYRLPSTVMKTAVKPMNVNDSLEFDFEIGDPTLQFYVYMHFAELERLRGNQYREFSIKLNGNLWEKSVVPKYLRSTTILTTQPMRGSKLRFALCKTSYSTLPPILNAMEIYILRDTLQAPTNQEDGMFLLCFYVSVVRKMLKYKLYFDTDLSFKKYQSMQSWTSS